MGVEDNLVFDRTKKPEHKVVRNQLRSLTKHEIKLAKLRYDQGLRESIADRATSVKKFWNIMKQLYGGKIKASIPTLVDNGVHFCSDLEKG